MRIRLKKKHDKLLLVAMLLKTGHSIIWCGNRLLATHTKLGELHTSAGEHWNTLCINRLFERQKSFSCLMYLCVETAMCPVTMPLTYIHSGLENGFCWCDSCICMVELHFTHAVFVCGGWQRCCCHYIVAWMHSSHCSKLHSGFSIDGAGRSSGWVKSEWTTSLNGLDLHQCIWHE